MLWFQDAPALSSSSLAQQRMDVHMDEDDDVVILEAEEEENAEDRQKGAERKARSLLAALAEKLESVDDSMHGVMDRFMQKLENVHNSNQLSTFLASCGTHIQMGTRRKRTIPITIRSAKRKHLSRGRPATE